MEEQVKVGDEVEIAAKGQIVKGTVVAANWFYGHGWDIELTKTNNAAGYSHWKQWVDGGAITEINGRVIN